MTAAGWFLFVGGACSLCVAAWWARRDRPERELCAVTWIALSIIGIAVGMIWFTEPYEAIRRSSFVAPIAGAPLVLRIDAAHSAFGTQRLPIPGMHSAVLP